MIVLESPIDGSQYFRWAEALWLPKWRIHAFPTREQIENIREMARVMDLIRELLGSKPIKIHSWLRPDKYNELVGGAIQSMHRLGGAVDFSPSAISCDEARSRLEPKLHELKIRMEDNPGSSWVHVDIREPLAGKRFFLP